MINKKRVYMIYTFFKKYYEIYFFQAIYDILKYIWYTKVYMIPFQSIYDKVFMILFKVYMIL